MSTKSNTGFAFSLTGELGTSGRQFDSIVTLRSKSAKFTLEIPNPLETGPNFLKFDAWSDVGHVSWPQSVTLLSDRSLRLLSYWESRQRFHISVYIGVEHDADDDYLILDIENKVYGSADYEVYVTNNFKSVNIEQASLTIAIPVKEGMDDTSSSFTMADFESMDLLPPQKHARD